MARGSKYDLTSFRKAIIENAPDKQAIADAVGCTRSTVYSYIKKYPELAKAYESASGEVAPDGVRARSDEQVVAAIKGSMGVIATVASRLGVHRDTVKNYLRQSPELSDLFDAEKSSLISDASGALAADVRNPNSDGHQRAYMFVLKTWGKDEGFVERTEVTGADGGHLLELSPDVLAQAHDLGLDMSEVVRQFEKLVRMQAMAIKGSE